MTKVFEPRMIRNHTRYAWFPTFAVPEGQTLVSEARTDDPPVVPMSGGQGPAGAAKPHV